MAASRSQPSMTSSIGSIPRLKPRSESRRCGPPRRGSDVAATRRDGCSDAPTECRRVDRRIPPADELVIELQERDGEARHLEAGDVVPDERTPDRDAPTREDAGDAIEGDVQLDERGAAHAVDERQYRI